jgi:uncharacterized RDD family membrane protein YckC
MRAVRLTLRRLAGYLADILVLAFLLLPIAFGVGALLGTTGVTGPTVWLRSLVLVSLPAWIYFIVLERTLGTTIGKRVMHLRTVGDDGSRPGWSAAVLRTAVKLLPWELVHAGFFALAGDFTAVSPLQIGIGVVAYALMLALAAVPLRTGGHRSLHDLVAGTRVVAA